MRMRTLFTFSIFIFFLSAAPLFAQQNSDCTDILHLRNGSVLRGKITAYMQGVGYNITTWSGLQMTVPEGSVKKIVQRCKDEKRGLRDYDFKEQGLYNATRLSTLVGQNYSGQNSPGYSLHHSAGWMFSRMLGVGIGGGMEIFNVDSGEPVTYPVFAEMRGYLQAKNVTPFFVLGGGWAFTGKNSQSPWGQIENWSGGWHAKAQIGYRLGNHFTLFGGLNFQKKVRNWQSNWGGEWGKDRMLHKRLELGIGVIL